MDGGATWLFSYGTLRQPEVQRTLFGRELVTEPDALLGFRLDRVTITDPEVIATSGSDSHPILRRSSDPAAEVAGAALAVTPEDLARADAYEVDGYARVAVTLKSGRRAFVYVDRTEG